jgi:HEAT repeat protein
MPPGDPSEDTNQATNPLSELDTSDPGDDTQRRFRFQATVAAMNSLALLDEEGELVAIFCEHHEDILLVGRDGKVVAKQVKTRAEHLPALRLGGLDTPVRSALVRFIKKDLEFPGQFDRFVLETNVGFMDEAGDGHSLPRLLRMVQDAGSDDEALSDKDTGKRIAELALDAGVDTAVVLTTLRKTFQEGNAGLNDIEGRLILLLQRHPIFTGYSATVSNKVAQALIGHMARASARPFDPWTFNYTALKNEPDVAEANEVIRQKRIIREDLLAIFAEQGVQGAFLDHQHWPFIIEAGAMELDHDLALICRYDPAADVRTGDLLADPAVDLWRRGGAAFLVMSGKSGQGSTWRLCALALALAAEAPVVVVSADSGPRQVAESAARKFWYGLCRRRYEQTSLDEISRYVREAGVVPSGSTWLYILVDGVKTVSEAQSLNREIGGVDGVRLAFTSSDQVARWLGQGHDAPGGVVLPVSDFTEAEVRHYIAGDDPSRWHDVPTDVQLIIRFPLLALIYRSLAGESGWDAKNEYELYDAYFTKYVRDRLHQQGHAHADVALTDAGLDLWDGGLYPWTARQMRDTYRFEPALTDALIGLGFLKRDEDRFTVWHDRLKEWLVSRALAQALEERQRDVGEVGRRCRDLLFPERYSADSEQPLVMRYVPMDLIWHLVQHHSVSSTISDVLDTLLRRMEEEPVHFKVHEIFYQGFLATVGSKIAPAIFRRLKAMNGEQNAWNVRKAMTKCLSEFETDTVAPTAIELLGYEDADVRLAAADILRARPAPEALPILRERLSSLKAERAAEHVAHTDPTENDNISTSRPQKRNVFWEWRSVIRAIRACVRLSPNWLADEIGLLSNPAGRVAMPDDVDALIDLLRYTQDSGECWRRSKEAVRPWTATGEVDSDLDCERGFADSIYHWRDRAEVDWLRARVGRNGCGLATRCLHALIRIAPVVALEILGDLPPDQVRYTGDWGLGLLLAQMPDATCTRLNELLQTEPPPKCWAYTDLFAQMPQAFSNGILDYLFDEGFLKVRGVEGEPALWRMVQWGKGLTDIEHLRRLWLFAETETETRLVVLFHDIAAKNAHDPRLDELMNFLFRIGGTGFTDVVNSRIASSEHFIRLKGIEQAHLRPDEETIQLLEALAIHPVKPDAPENEPLLDRYAGSAQEALALIGAYGPLIRSVIIRASASNLKVIDTCRPDAPLSDDDMALALETLKAEPTHPGAILALGVGRRTDYVPHITSVLISEDVRADNPITNACHYALAVIPNLSLTAVQALAERLPYARSDWLLWGALKSNSSGAALQVLLEYLKNGLARFRGGPYSVADIDNVADVARHLLSEPSTQREAVALCKARFEEDSELDRPARFIVSSLASDAIRNQWVRDALDCQQVRDYLLRASFDSRERDTVQAVSGLAAYAPADAYTAGLRWLRDGNENERMYAAHLLLEINRDRALLDLFDVIASETEIQRVREHTARWLAQQAEGEDEERSNILHDLLLERALSADPKQRSAAGLVLGYRKPDDVVNATILTLMEDGDAAVFQAACAAWHKLESARKVDKLVEAFLCETDAGRRSVLMVAASDQAELGNTCCPAPDWLNRMAERLTALEWDYIWERLRTRQDERDRRDKTMDNITALE